MKVLFLSAGNSVHTVKWVNALADRGHNVYLVYNKGHEPRNQEVDDRVVCYGMRYGGNAGYYLNAGQLKKKEEEICPDVINVHYASGYGTLARKSNIGPVLLSVWGSDVYDFPYKSIIHNRILKKNINYANMLASTSECMAKQLRKVMGKPELDVNITPFGVDLKLFDPKIYKSEEQGSNIVIGNIKMLKPKYGIDKLINAVGILKNRLEENNTCGRQIVLRIYGEGSQKQELKELVKKLGLNSNVSFEGFISNVEVPGKLSELDIFCAISQLDSESFGVAVVEAMAMRVPVVASDVDGFKEVLSDRETGIIVPREDINQIADALEMLVMNAERRKEYGENGRKRVEALYNWDKNVDEMEKLYEAINNKRS